MDQFDAVVDTVLAFLQERLPPPLYSLLINVLSHCLALCTASFRLLGSLISKHPDEWDLQSMLPPIVTLLAAYLALASLYRTTTWLFKLAFWFVKWGSIIGILGMGAGWLAAVTGGNGGGDNALGDMLTNFVNGGSNSPGVKARTSPSRTKGTKERKYRAWDKFDGAGNWQYAEGQDGQKQPNEAQIVMQNIVETANQVLGGNTWWQVAKAMAGGKQTGSDGEEKGRAKGATKSR